MRCDSHVHVVGPIARYPQLANRNYLADVADLATLQRLGSARDVRRFVIVQPSFYGADNTVLLETLDTLGALGRGVAVIDENGTSSAMLDDLERRGVRGLRVNLYSALGKPKPFDMVFAANESIAGSKGWHVEVIAPLALVAEHAGLLAKSRVPVVIDHYGVYGLATPDSIDGRCLLELIALPHVWIKLSAPYRVSDNPVETKPDADWVKAILERGVGRCVWGSDWPFTAPHEAQRGPNIVAPYRALSYMALFDDFIAAVGSPELVHRILQNNPARLYGFADS